MIQCSAAAIVREYGIKPRKQGLLTSRGVQKADFLYGLENGRILEDCFNEEPCAKNAHAHNDRYIP